MFLTCGKNSFCFRAVKHMFPAQLNSKVGNICLDPQYAKPALSNSDFFKYFFIPIFFVFIIISSVFLVQLYAKSCDLNPSLGYFARLYWSSSAILILKNAKVLLQAPNICLSFILSLLTHFCRQVLLALRKTHVIKVWDILHVFTGARAQY